MTREEIMQLDGRELDAAVARMVFGLEPVYVEEQPWECHIDPDNPSNSYCNFGGAVFTAEREWVVNDYVLPCRDGGLNGGHILPHYSSDIAATWHVVERMFERGFYPEISYDSDGTGRHDKAKVYVIFHTEDHYCGWPCAANAVKDVPQRVPTAICRAALLAVMFGAGDVARSRQREGTR